MSIHIAIHHLTTYRYDRSVTLGPQTIRLRPAPHCRSRILSYSLKVQPTEHFTNWQQDPQANYLARLVFEKPTTEFRIEVDLIAEMAVINPFDFFLEPYAEKSPFQYDASLHGELAPYRTAPPKSPLLDAYVESISRTPRNTNDFLVELNQKLSQHIRYVIRLEPGLQTPEETLEKRSGSCRDTAWLLVHILRRLDMAARFVSGYLVQLTADTKPLDDGPAGPSADFTDLHAWCEVYLPGAGWIGLDPTSGLFAGEGHLPLACTPEPASAAPVSGLIDECETTFEHEMTVTRVWEAPRVTKPYTDEQWAEIEALGHAVDAEMRAGDVRLTMGGEPTFVSIDDPDGEEWNTAALGPNKKRLATDLFYRLRDEYAPRGLVHFGQGKWYPGEPLPRWSLNSYWRRDGEPLWENTALLANESAPRGANEEIAGRFLRGVASRLGLDPRYVFPAYEDVYYYLWREHNLPVNVDPFDARLDDPLERERLRRLFTTGLDKVAGYVLPVARDATKTRAWRTGPWHLRGERCHLVPGDSPLGLRLPLDSQPWLAKGDRVPFFPPDQTQDFPPLTARAELRRQYPTTLKDDGTSGGTGAARSGDPGAGSRGGKPGAGSRGGSLGEGSRGDLGLGKDGARAGEQGVDPDRAPLQGESATWIKRTAMCAEPRNGVLYVFMPPVDDLDDYVALVAAVEATAESLGHPVLLEGYEPPRDPRLVRLSVTPDPGVIEVNIHPAASWDQMVSRTTHLYEAARLSRLASEKFMLDGRHQGTGGGNHVVLGGATVNDSPFLRRPDLLRSLVSYWHQHPSLSFLFSGMFIGPTSQAPRIDEARNDAVFEIELAFRELDRISSLHGDQTPPWDVDRLFRDLLVDVTGNTHRTEFCIDKLFSPDGPAGRLGLLEMRAFEMPPHARMSLTQQLLLRSLVSRFWKTPYEPQRLARWGTELHDRFMLPYFVWQDFEDVIEELGADGYPLNAEWFAPHFEFRFPKYGDFATRGTELEIRAALEPWHVMGEDAAAGGTARYVDSSLERLQVKAKGLAPDRFVVTCNGRALPLQPTGRVGEFVAGVRYRAWQPPRCLHPHIGVHAPLTFDLVDTWMSRSLGGCEYHVAHPGGRAFDRLPINAFEAEGRRLSRFFRLGHTPGRMIVVPPAPNVDFPFTLDMRR